MGNIKTAFMKEYIKTTTDFLKKHPEATGAVVGAIAMPSLVELSRFIPYVEKKDLQESKSLAKAFGVKTKGKEFDNFKRLKRIIGNSVLAASGGITGYNLGHIYKILNQSHSFRPNTGSTSNFQDLMGVVGLTGKEKTKKEAQSLFRQMAIWNHPDMISGSNEKMQKINEAWSAIKKTDWFNKLAFFKGFERASSRNLKNHL